MHRSPFCWLLVGLGLVGGALAAARDTPPDATLEIAATLDALHRAAAEADEDTYFGLFSPEAVFLGTDASERWTIEAFREFALPYFQRDSAWTYTPRDRAITLLPVGSGAADVAFFDELLDQEKYGECRGTGVVRRVDGSWKIAQYHLTFPIPNEIAGPITRWVQNRGTGTRWVFVVRHAEKGEGEDPGLTEAGRRRAGSLARILADAPIAVCVASPYRRTIDTAAPTATAHGREVETIAARDIAALIARLDALDPGSAALVSGHSNTVPAILKALGVTEEIQLAEADYGHLFAVRRSPAGAELLRLGF